MLAIEYSHYVACCRIDFESDPTALASLKTAILERCVADSSTSGLAIKRMPKLTSLLTSHTSLKVPRSLRSFFRNEDDHMQVADGPVREHAGLCSPRLDWPDRLAAH